MQGIWRHIKTNNRYLVTGVRKDCTNATDGRVMVEYQNGGGEKFCREYGEFREKFTSVSTLDD